MLWILLLSRKPYIGPQCHLNMCIELKAAGWSVKKKPIRSGFESVLKKGID
jgi:hypothetical protein